MKHPALQRCAAKLEGVEQNETLRQCVSDCTHEKKEVVISLALSDKLKILKMTYSEHS